MWKIGDVEIPNQVVIAPMAGISNPAFRSICHQFGAGLVCAEMLSDKAIYYENTKTMKMSEVLVDEHPMSMQLFGHDIDTMVYAAKRLDKETSCDIIDINMGCPVTKVIKAHAGSALMLEPEHAFELVRAIVDAVDKPVTVKMRAGFDKDHINAVELAKSLETAGISAITIHGRTKTQMYEGKADWRIIKQVKEAVGIPVIGNGDIKSVEDMQRMLDTTGCDAVAIGRGVLGNPFLIKDCVRYLETGDRIEPVSYNERFELMREHARRLIELKGEKVGMQEMRGHATWYIKGMPLSHHIKDQLSKVNTYKEMQDIINVYQENLKAR